MKQPSLKINMLLNTIRSILGILFPLVTFPYVSRVLGVENLGKYNFANSIISYFILLSALGIYAYAVREGARYRDNKEYIKRFSAEIFTINLIATVISYVLLTVTILYVGKMQSYAILLIILSLQILFKTLSVEWIYTIYEDFLYITIRSIIIQIISLILMFALVHKQDDYLIYAAIVSFAAGGSSVFNFFHSKKYIKICVTRNLNLTKHIKPILLIFATSLTVSVYVSSDTTILGFLCGDSVVGIYSVSVKVYNLIKTVIISILSVTIPRLAFCLGQDDSVGYKAVVNELFKTMTTLVVPCVVGIYLLSSEIVRFIAGDSFISAISSLKLLSVALIFSLFAWLWGQCVLMTLKMEQVLFYATLVSAIVNVGLNFILIPVLEENAAAITTIIAEMICMLFLWWYGRKYVRIDGVVLMMSKVFIGCGAIIGVTLLLKQIQWEHFIIFMIIDVIVSIILYLGVELILKNEVVLDCLIQIKKRISKKKRS